MNDESSGPEPVPLDGLSREVSPPAGLEERVVEALHGEGLLGVRVRPGWGAGWRVAAAAAGLALFAAGFGAGQYAEGRAAVDLVAALQAADATERAALIQRTGSLYVRAVHSLDGAVLGGPGHEVARAALRAAVVELARLSPDDGTYGRILSILDGGEPGSDSPSQTLFWF